MLGKTGPKAGKRIPTVITNGVGIGLIFLKLTGTEALNGNGTGVIQIYGNLTVSWGGGGGGSPKVST